MRNFEDSSVLMFSATDVDQLPLVFRTSMMTALSSAEYSVPVPLNIFAIFVAEMLKFFPPVLVEDSDWSSL